MLDETITSLEALRGTTASDLSGDPILRAAAERLMQVIVDLAVDINGHLLVASTGAAPQTARDSFTSLIDIGVLDQSLGDRLALAAGMRNILVRQYIDIRPDIVAPAIDSMLNDFPQYIQKVARFVTNAG